MTESEAAEGWRQARISEVMALMTRNGLTLADLQGIKDGDERIAANKQYSENGPRDSA